MMVYLVTQVTTSLNTPGDPSLVWSDVSEHHAPGVARAQHRGQPRAAQLGRHQPHLGQRAQVQVQAPVLEHHITLLAHYPSTNL